MGISMLTLLLLLTRAASLDAAATTQYFNEMFGATPEELCTAYCEEYHHPLACGRFDITSRAYSSADAVRSSGVLDLPGCVQLCLTSGMSFDGTPQDFFNRNTIQCRRNHLRMMVQEQSLANSDHCLHAMLQGRERCNTDTWYYKIQHDIGEAIFWNPYTAVPPLQWFSKLMYYGLGALWEGAMRGRLMVQYPYLDLPDNGVTCSSEEQRRFRTVDGTCNSLEMLRMGAVDTPFVQILRPSTPRDDLPDPQAVAAILKRPEELTSKHLAPFNQLVVGWIQMMTHDWFQHEQPDTTGLNRVTHWWDRYVSPR